MWLTRTVPVGGLHRQPASTPGHPLHMALWKPCVQPPASMQVPGPTAASTGKGVRLGSIESLAFYSLYWRVGGVGKARSLQLDRCIGFKLLVRRLGEHSTHVAELLWGSVYTGFGTVIWTGRCTCSGAMLGTGRKTRKDSLIWAG